MKSCITFLLILLLIFPARSLPTSPQARGAWRSVRTNNLFVVGNADGETLKQVAVWLEFFHAAFGRLVSRSVFDSSSPTTVIVFRDEASFIPFKPLYQGRPQNVAGYFQSGEDVNYIAIALDEGERLPFSTAFHEYVHLHLKDNLPGAPLWLNEGLAELYGALQFSRGEALLGALIPQYAYLLRGQELLPLSTLFAIDNASPHYNEQSKSGIFYAQSWAVTHFLMFGADGGRQQQFKQFLQQISQGETSEKALERAFGTSVEVIEKEFRDYVRRGEFPVQHVASADNPHAYAAYTATQRSALSDGEANYYLGDLLLHINRPKDAEAYFKQAIAAEPTFIPTYASLGRLYAHQKRYAEAKKYLQRATLTSQNYLIHYLYAYVLSREGMTDAGYVKEYSPQNVAVMRDQLLRSIKLAPEFAPQYYLLALVDLVADERLDEAEAMARKAQQLAPSRPTYSLLLAAVYARRGNSAEARSIVEPLTRNSDSFVRSGAQELLDRLNNSGTTASRNSADSRNSAALGNAIANESAQLVTSRMIMGGDGSSAGSTSIRDGQTIEKSESLLTLDEVLERYVNALGGAEAIKAATSRVMKGTLDVVGVSRGGTFKLYAQAPNKMFSIMNAHPLGTVKVGFNGRAGWEVDERGLRRVNGTELEALLRDGDFYYPLNLKQNFKKVTLLGKSRIGYREVYVLELQPRSLPAPRSGRGAARAEARAEEANTADKMYLDTATYLPVRMNSVRTVSVPGGGSGQSAVGRRTGRNALAARQVTIPMEIYLDDWRTVDGIKYPFRISQSGGYGSLIFTVKEIGHNVSVDAKMFELPAR
jgi:tetratricopeptide (TPR) repeat protein